MTETELLTAYWEVAERMDANFQFWLSGTFAMLLSFHFAGNTFGKTLKWFLVALYVIFSVTFFSKFYAWGVMSLLIRDDLVALNTSYLVLSEGHQFLNGLGTSLILILGFVGTIFFSLRNHSPKNVLTEKDT